MSEKIFKKIRLIVLNILWDLPFARPFVLKRLPTYRKGYKNYWVEDGGKEYRLSMYQRQKKDGTLPLLTNPTVDELIKEIDKYKPEKVLEMGCGYGRSLEELKTHFDISGADISKDLLDLCDPTFRVFELDIVDVDPKWLQDHQDSFDVVFCRAVMQYFFDHSADMVKAMKNMELIARKKVICWEWPHVCDYMKKTYPSDKFDYRPIAFRVE